MDEFIITKVEEEHISKIIKNDDGYYIEESKTWYIEGSFTGSLIQLIGHLLKLVLGGLDSETLKTQESPFDSKEAPSKKTEA